MYALEYELIYVPLTEEVLSIGKDALNTILQLFEDYIWKL
jgi:hypothetical protein